MLLKIIVVALLIIILYCLGSAAFYLVKDGSTPEKMAKALSWRIVLSLVLFLFLMLSYMMGWIHPHPI